ncbi:ArsR/SmtB family transcription factor [Tepidimonas sp.]|uniref:ArsR/SmtB family transcription factor n=1 Tax=Tepidimonas sp. TaxID=2002775 RepID=UPI003918D96C
MSRSLSDPPLHASSPDFESVARHFSVLGEPARLRILHAVCQSERCVNDIMQVTGMAQANVSRHLARLHQAGLLVRRREGSRVFYRVAPSSHLDLCRLITQQVVAGQAHPGRGQGCGIGRPTSVFPVESKEETSV